MAERVPRAGIAQHADDGQVEGQLIGQPGHGSAVHALGLAALDPPAQEGSLGLDGRQPVQGPAPRGPVLVLVLPAGIYGLAGHGVSSFQPKYLRGEWVNSRVPFRSSLWRTATTNGAAKPTTAKVSCSSAADQPPA